VLVGPTSSGKSAAALAAAELLGGEIISADSMKVYRGMDVGTAKPTAQERRRVAHHLLDILDPSESYDAARFAADCSRAIEEITSRGRAPVVEGGSALYLKAWLEGLFEGPARDERIRSRLRAEAAELGRAHLHRRLAEVDPASAERIHPNDYRRIERALEVYELTGRPMSEMHAGTESRVALGVRIAGISVPRERLYESIDRRVDSMMAAGLLDETRGLASRPGGLSKEAAGALGYAEILAHVRGEIDLSEAVRLIKRNTRRFARKQMAWFRRFQGVTWVEPEEDEPAASVAARLMEAWGLKPQP
jgi:tRNA dimethylallyltransferase